jgi:hypothetical protein
MEYVLLDMYLHLVHSAILVALLTVQMIVLMEVHVRGVVLGDVTIKTTVVSLQVAQEAIHTEVLVMKIVIVLIVVLHAELVLQHVQVVVLPLLLLHIP